MPSIRKKPSGWTIAWLVWLGAFLAIEIPAAIWGKSATLSWHVWRRWFDETWERWLIGITGVLVSIAHFVFEAPAWWSVIIGLGACSVVILLAEIRHHQKVTVIALGVVESKGEAMKSLSPSKLLVFVVKLVADGKLGKIPQSIYWKLAGIKTWITVGISIAALTLQELSGAGLCDPCAQYVQLLWTVAGLLLMVGLYDGAVREIPPRDPKDGVFVTPPDTPAMGPMRGRLRR